MNGCEDCILPGRNHVKRCDAYYRYNKPDISRVLNIIDQIPFDYYIAKQFQKSNPSCEVISYYRHHDFKDKYDYDYNPHIIINFRFRYVDKHIIYYIDNDFWELNGMDI
jgi:hypothetical protein